MSKLFTVQLTEDEVNQAAYALNELANKRREQAIDWKRPGLNEEAEAHDTLARKIYGALNQ